MIDEWDEMTLEPTASGPHDDARLEKFQFENFLIWVDGVGGYLVCSAEENRIGQAIPETDVSIPVRGDIDRAHVSIRSIDNSHLLTPLGAVVVDGQLVSKSLLLTSELVFRMGDLVEMRYRRPHPYSSTAVLDFESRHRTFPWSDAVLLAGDSIVLGPEKRNHIVCSRWTEEIVLYRRSGQWFCKSKSPLVVDGIKQINSRPLSGSSRIESAEVSFSLEVVKPRKSAR